MDKEKKIKEFADRFRSEVQCFAEVANRCYERTKNEHGIKEGAIIAYEQGLYLGKADGLFEAMDLFNMILKDLYGEDGEKEIAGMAKALYGIYCGEDKCGQCKEPECPDWHRAKFLYNAGYGNVKQARKETAKELLQELYDKAIQYGKTTDGIELMAQKYGVEVKETSDNVEPLKGERI